MIHTDNHAPAHVHAWYQGSEALIEFEAEIRVRENNGMNNSQLRRAKRIVSENQEFLQNEWRKIYD